VTPVGPVAPVDPVRLKFSTQASAFEGTAAPATNTTLIFEYPEADSWSTTRKIFSVVSVLSFDLISR